MTARGGLGKAFAAAVGEWAAASERVVRPAKAADPRVPAAEPAGAPELPGGAADSGLEQSAVRP